MQRVVIHAPGGYEQLRLEAHPTPTAGPGEVLVEVEAIGVNYADCVVRMGLYSSAKEYVGWPITPGFEVAGRVAEIGEGIDDLAVGDEVFAVTRFGGYATHVRAPRRQVFRRPAGWSAAECAAFPTVTLTAWYALRELCKLRPGARVLVHSAAGGVGTSLVRIAKICGAWVVGVVGAGHKVETARRFGADAVIDKRAEDLWAEAARLAPGGYDVILDANGVATLKESYAHLAPAGRLVIYGFHTMLSRSRGASDGEARASLLARLGDRLRLPGRGRPNYLKLARDYLRTPRFNPLDLTTLNRSVLAFNLSYLFERADVLEEAMGELMAWIESGELYAPVVKAYPLARVGAAHADLESAQTIGKLVLTV